MRFTEMLLTATIVTGFIWLLDAILWRPKRHMQVLSSGPHSSAVKEPVLVEYAKAFFPILLIVFLLRSFLAEPFRIPSGSMRPTLKEGDFILVNKYAYGLRLPLAGSKLVEVSSPKRGDVIVFQRNRRGESIDMIKRVVGLPGDHIQYKDKTIYINGQAVKQEFIKDTFDKDVNGHVTWPVRELAEQLNSVTHDIYVHTEDNFLFQPNQNEDIVVPAGSYFVMGDNRDNSDDSRAWGFVPDKDIMGRAVGIWMSWDSADHSLRWNRMFTKIH